MPKGIVYSPTAYDTRRGDKHSRWMGDNASSITMHDWIRRHYGKASMCEFKDETCSKTFHWSNKNHVYTRDINDWQQLCVSHHRRYDYKKFNIIPWNKGNKFRHEIVCIWCSKVVMSRYKNKMFCSRTCSSRHKNLVRYGIDNRNSTRQKRGVD